MPTTPPKAAETAAITVLLTNEQIARLDEISVVIRRNSGTSLGRSALIRALTLAALTLHTDWKHCRNEDEVCFWILARLGPTPDWKAAEQKFRQLRPGKSLSLAS